MTFDNTIKKLDLNRYKSIIDLFDDLITNYNSLVAAIGDAIDKQMAEDGTEYFTDERSNLYIPTVDDLDFDKLMEAFNNIVNDLIENNPEDKFKEYWQPRIVEITDKYLGKGMKVNQCSREQVEALDLIVTDLKELVKA